MPKKNHNVINMKRVYLLLVYTVFFMLNQKCKVQDLSKDNLLISLEKTACMGKCPVYELKIYNNRVAILHAHENLDKKGKYKTRLDKEQVQYYVDRFTGIEFFSLEDKYTSHFMDLPTTYITFQHKGKVKNIKDYDNAPEKLNELEKELEALVKDEKWRKIGD